MAERPLAVEICAACGVADGFEHCPRSPRECDIRQIQVVPKAGFDLLLAAIKKHQEIKLRYGVFAEDLRLYETAGLGDE